MLVVMHVMPVISVPRNIPLFIIFGIAYLIYQPLAELFQNLTKHLYKSIEEAKKNNCEFSKGVILYQAIELKSSMPELIEKNLINLCLEYQVNSIKFSQKKLFLIEYFGSKKNIPKYTKAEIAEDLATRSSCEIM